MQEALIKNFNPPAAGEVTPSVAWPELWVMDDSDFKQAQVIVNEELRTRTKHHPHWKCPKCGEQLEGQFNVCWKCGYTRQLAD